MLTYSASSSRPTKCCQQYVEPSQRPSTTGTGINYAPRINSCCVSKANSSNCRLAGNSTAKLNRVVSATDCGSISLATSMVRRETTRTNVHIQARSQNHRCSGQHSTALEYSDMLLATVKGYCTNTSIQNAGAMLRKQFDSCLDLDDGEAHVYGA